MARGHRHLSVLGMVLEHDGPDDQDGGGREEWLRNSFEFAYATQFITFFHSAFGLDSFSYHDLEALLLWEPDQVTGAATNFFKKILKTLPGARFTSVDNWLHVLEKEYRKRGKEKPFDSPVPEGPSSDEVPTLKLADLSLETKVQILFDICEFYLENIHHFYVNLLRGYDLGIYWRLDSLGKDVHGRLYWLFSDGRLFRETEKKVGDFGPEGWELVCWNHDTWSKFRESELSNRPTDRKLKTTIQEQWPDIDLALIEQDKIAKRKSKELYALKYTYDLVPRKRSSRLQAKEAMKKLHDQEKDEERVAAAISGRTIPPESPASQHKLSREERAEHRRLRLEKEAQEKALKELEEHTEEIKEEADVDIVGGDEHPIAPIKLIFRRPSISEENPSHVTKKPKLKPVPPPKPDDKEQKILSMMELAIQRELANRKKQTQAGVQMQPIPPVQQYIPQQIHHQMQHPQHIMQHYAQSSSQTLPQAIPQYQMPPAMYYPIQPGQMPQNQPPAYYYPPHYAPQGHPQGQYVPYYLPMMQQPPQTPDSDSQQQDQHLPQKLPSLNQPFPPYK